MSKTRLESQADNYPRKRVSSISRSSIGLHSFHGIWGLPKWWNV